MTVLIRRREAFDANEIALARALIRLVLDAEVGCLGGEHTTAAGTRRRARPPAA